MERREKYRLFLYVLLIGSITALFICWMILIWEKIPGAIHIRAGIRQDLDLNVPVSGKLYKAPAETEDGAIPVTGMNAAVDAREAKTLSVDLAEPLTLYAEDIETYTMDLKLFGLIPFKTVNVQVINDKTLIPAGIPIGIYVKTEGILVIATGDFTGDDGQAKEPVGHLLKEGDYILKVNGREVEGKAAFMRQIEESNGEELVLTILREDQEFDLKVRPERNQDGEYKLGIWIRDNAQGVGTLTYLDENNSFGALGHGINDMDTATLMNLKNGSLYTTEIVSITKGENGTPGRAYRSHRLQGKQQNGNNRGQHRGRHIRGTKRIRRLPHHHTGHAHRPETGSRPGPRPDPLQRRRRPPALRRKNYISPPGP